MQDNEIIKKFVPGDIYFDIGAHKGIKADLFIEKGYKSILVEPQPILSKFLSEKYIKNPLVTIIPMVVGKCVDILEMSISTAEPVLSTFSSQWKEGRFKNTIWDEKTDVLITTLDLLISKYGNPRYIKIDVEGYEFEVLKGLTRRLGIISIEFTSEYINNTINCIGYLDFLGYTKFNVCLGENEKFSLDTFINKDEMINILKINASEHPLLWGDVYAN